MKEVDEAKAKEELEKGYEKAEKLLQDEDKLEETLQRLEKKLQKIPAAGDTLAMVPTMISMVRSYIKKEYTKMPIGTVVAVISALVYVLSPIDLIPDIIPGVGYIDDTAVVATCLLLVGSDIEEYQKWRTENKKMLNV